MTRTCRCGGPLAAGYVQCGTCWRALDAHKRPPARRELWVDGDGHSWPVTGHVCNGCGYPLHPVLVDAGRDWHVWCLRSGKGPAPARTSPSPGERQGKDGPLTAGASGVSATPSLSRGSTRGVT